MGDSWARGSDSDSVDLGSNPGSPARESASNRCVFVVSSLAGIVSIPKGEYDEAEDALAAAKRELREETGIVVAGEFLELGTFKQPSGKLISAWAIERDFDPVELRSNTCSVEWPPKSGRTVDVPEVDRAAWFSITEAVNKITKGLVPKRERLSRRGDAGLSKPT